MVIHAFSWIAASCHTPFAVLAMTWSGVAVIRITTRHREEGPARRGDPSLCLTSSTLSGTSPYRRAYAIYGKSKSSDTPFLDSSTSLCFARNDNVNLYILTSPCAVLYYVTLRDSRRVQVFWILQFCCAKQQNDKP